MSWEVRPLSEVVLLQRGHDLPTSVRVDGSVPVIGSFGVTGHHNEPRYDGPGVAIGRSGASIGTATFVKEPYWPLNTCLFVRDFRGNDPRWVYQLLNFTDFRAYNSGSAQPSLNRNYLRSVPVLVPPLGEQRAIAEVLGALDDKIAANVRVVAAADRLASAELSRMLCQDEPQSVPLTRAAEFVNGKAFTKDATGTGRMVIRIAELNSGPGGSTVYNDLDVEEKHLAGPGDLLFAWSGSLTVNRWFRDEGIVNQHIFKVIPKSGYPLWCVDAVLRRKLEEFRAIAADKATTMGHIQRRHLDEGAQFPSEREIKECDPLMQGLWERALSAERESLRLAELRGALLPALMSGRLRVKDAEKAVGEAV